MTDKKGARLGPWFFDCTQLVLGSLATILLVAQIALSVWRRYEGESWSGLWPTGLSALAMVMVLISIVLRARRGGTSVPVATVGSLAVTCRHAEVDTPTRDARGP